MSSSRDIPFSGPTLSDPHQPCVWLTYHGYRRILTCPVSSSHGPPRTTKRILSRKHAASQPQEIKAGNWYGQTHVSWDARSQLASYKALRSLFHDRRARGSIFPAHPASRVRGIAAARVWVHLWPRAQDPPHCILEDWWERWRGPAFNVCEREGQVTE